MGQVITVQRIAGILMCGIIGLSTTAFAAEKYYKWIDQNGTMQYTQNPPPASARKVLKSVQVSTHIPADIRNRGSASADPVAVADAAVPATSIPPASSAATTPTPATADQPAIFKSDSVAPANQ